MFRENLELTMPESDILCRAMSCYIKDLQRKRKRAFNNNVGFSSMSDEERGFEIANVHELEMRVLDVWERHLDESVKQFKVSEGQP